MKRFLLLPLVALLVLGLAAPVFAREPRIVDEAELLTQAQEAALDDRAQALGETYGIDAVILTVDSLNGENAESYADDYYDTHGYGFGDDYSGVLLLLAMDTREWAISTCGDGIYALTDYGIESLFSDIAPYLAEDDYDTAFTVYLEQLEIYYRKYTRGTPVDGDPYPYDGPGSYEPGTREEVVYAPGRKVSAGQIAFRVLISLSIGGAAGGITLAVMRSGMNTAKGQSGAYNYMNGNSFHLTNRQDILLGSRTVRSERSQNTGGGDRGGGGSSVHTGSSGRSHGGGHGHF